MLDQYTLGQMRGVGPKTQGRLNKMNIHSLFDLLLHLPRQYQDRQTSHQISALTLDETVLVQGVVQGARVVYGKRRQLICEVTDDTGTLYCRFFHFNRDQQAALSQTGTPIRCYGQVRRHHPRGVAMIHPEYTLGDEPLAAPQGEQAYLTPIYPTTAGLQQATFHKLMPQALAALAQMPASMVELLPEHIRCQEGLVSIHDALLFVHRPPLGTATATLRARQHPLQSRLILEELLAHQWAMQHQQRTQAIAPALACEPDSKAVQWQQQLQSTLPFSLTAAQQRVVAEIRADCMTTRPMMRLLQGDVGSGKTLVAVMTVLQAVANGYQVAVMAPTEILAKQHQLGFCRWLSPLGIEVDALLGSQKTAKKRQVTADLASGAISVVVGTQALFQATVTFARLGLIIIDEQHRFGVGQRLALQEKGADGCQPHQLVMTATPIPRSLAMVAYAHCTQSIIDELPPGRTPVQTVVLSSKKREAVIARIATQCDAGAQVYWVCPLICESDSLQVQAAEVSAADLRERLPAYRVGLLHGKQSTDEKAAIMADFYANEIHILVATTVIEVGVDVPNASLMVVEDAERFGLAQLHQLRGRVGRGARQSHCVLLYGGRLSRDAQQRLAVMRDSADGFAVAEADLRMRGPGELMGTEQAGHWSFRLVDLAQDQSVVEQAQRLLRSLPPTPNPTQCALLSAWTRRAIRYLSA